MEQLVQELKHGETRAVEVPRPVVRPHHLLIRTRASLLSAGTERMLTEFGRASLIQKARQQPDKVRQVLEKVRTDGLVETVRAVKNKLETPIPLGYCNAGVVLEVGEGVRGFRIGDPVVSNGPHAEVVCVAASLCARIPNPVFELAPNEQEAFERAAFTVIGAVALQGVRVAQPALGETFAVIGLGLVGQLAVQILRANGCRVLGMDLRSERVALAERAGATGVELSSSQDPLAAANELTRGRGMDGVLITAATPSSEPVHQAAQMCRQRGRVVLVGVTGLQLSRSDFYRKELSFQVSCSYGPGRYDPGYERKGRDYPYGLVRWTAQRNFEAVLELMAEGKLDVEALITRRVPLARGPVVYEGLAKGDGGMGVVFTYPAAEAAARSVRLRASPRQVRPAAPVVGVIGAGAFATRTVLPLLRRLGPRRKLIATPGGTRAALAGRTFGFEEAAAEVDRVFEDDEIDTVFILTPHDSHADLACRGLEAGKNVFVEKPLAVTPEQLERIEFTYESAATQDGGPPILHVGFNRRFSPYVRKMRELLRSGSGPMALVMTVNAGTVDEGHWVDDPEISGGRIIGEACHFVDLLRFLVAAPIVDVKSALLRAGAEDRRPSDTGTIALSFADGSTGAVHYLANGHRRFPKERLEVFAGGRVLALDNFRRLRGYGWPRFRGMRSRWKQNKGHALEVEQFLRRVEDGGPAPIPFDELVEVTTVCFRAAGY